VGIEEIVTQDWVDKVYQPDTFEQVTKSIVVDNTADAQVGSRFGLGDIFSAQPAQV